MALTRKSEYFNTLSTTSKKRYETKVTTTRLQVDPYAIADNLWTHEPETIPPLSWSDVMLYMVSTPSPYTKEAIKVASNASVEHELIDKLYVGMEGNA